MLEIIIITIIIIDIKICWKLSFDNLIIVVDIIIKVNDHGPLTIGHGHHHDSYDNNFEDKIPPAPVTPQTAAVQDI